MDELTWCFIGGWIAFSLLATYAIWRRGRLEFRDKMEVLSVWLVPLFGAAMALLGCFGDLQRARYARKAHSALPPGFLTAKAPESICAEGVDAFALGCHCKVFNGFPLLDWEGLRAWAHSAGDLDQKSRILVDAQRAWMLHMQQALGAGYQVYEDEQTLVLSPLPTRMTVAAAQFIATAQRRISGILDGGLAQFDQDQKIILIVLADEATYYNYVGCYYPDEGEFAFSQGMFINLGMGHFVTTAADLDSMEQVIAHELTHSALDRLPMPRWLNEGLAVNTELLVIKGRKYMQYSIQELRAMQDAFWGEKEIQEFWSGEAFFRPDDGCMLAYELARVLVEQLNKDWGAFVGFALHAHADDAGASAAREYLGIELGIYVCAMLGKPPSDGWAPIGRA